MTRPLDILRELNKYEGANFGVWDVDASNVPRLTYGPHASDAIDYITSLRYCRPDLAGESLEGQYNAVDVEYQDANGNSLYTTRTRAHALLDGWGITKKPDPLSVRTTSLAQANQAGDILLDDKARPQGKGSLVIKGFVWDSYGRKIPAHRVRPGKNILIYDLRPAPGDLDTMGTAGNLNGKNVFRIVATDAKPYEVTCQLDNEADRLERFLATSSA